MRRGVFGGSFNPLHRGHLYAALLALETESLDQVLFVPASCPPHKSSEALAPARDRLAMLEAGMAGEPRFAISSIELEPDGPRFTIETLEALAGIYPQESLSFIMGMDSLVELPTWREPERILKEFQVIAVDRPGLDPDLRDLKLGGRPRLVTGNPFAISGTTIRERVARGLSIRHLVPEPVEQYIIGRGLYRTPLAKA